MIYPLCPICKEHTTAFHCPQCGKLDDGQFQRATAIVGREELVLDAENDPAASLALQVYAVLTSDYALAQALVRGQ